VFRDKEVEAAQSTLSHPIHPRPCPDVLFEFLENHTCCLQVARRAPLFHAGLGRLILPTHMVIDFRKPHVAEPGSNDSDMQFYILPTQQRLVEAADPI
jgi:hypothetical protein